MMGTALASSYPLLPPIPSTPTSVHVPKCQETASPDGPVALIPSSTTPIFRSDSLAAADAVTCPPPTFSTSTRRRRREITRIASSELWVCSQPFCTKKYKKTSVQSIAEHRDKCAARPLVKQWEVEREERRVSQLRAQQEVQHLRQQLREVQRQKEELQRHNAFLIQQASTASAGQTVLFNQFPATGYHQHYHQYQSPFINCSTNLIAWAPQALPPFGPPPPPSLSLFPAVPCSTSTPRSGGRVSDIASPTEGVSSLSASPPTAQPTATVQPQNRLSYAPMALGAAPESVFLSSPRMRSMQWGLAPHPLAIYSQSTPVSDALSASTMPEKGREEQQDHRGM